MRTFRRVNQREHSTTLGRANARPSVCRQHVAGGVHQIRRFPVLKVFQINEYEWYVAESIFDAVKAAMDDSGLPFDEACDDELGEVTHADMERLKFCSNEDGDEEPLTFTEQLARVNKADPSTPRLFASTEY
ncbi:MAG: hypothetical protein QM754_00600 [Tepidisphaeraceae bacterium]